MVKNTGVPANSGHFFLYGCGFLEFLLNSVTPNLFLLFNHMYLQIVKINGIYKIILIKTCFAVTFEFCNG